MTSKTWLTVLLLMTVGALAWRFGLPPEADRPTATAVSNPTELERRLAQRATPPAGGDFELRSASGPVRLSDLRGQAVLLYFGYARCPDICPTNLIFIANALRSLTEDEARRVRVVFVSVDPERDDPQRLRDYVAYFHPAMLGVTGSSAALAEVAARYGAVYRRAELPNSALGYAIDHSANTYLIAPDGRLMGHLDHASPPAVIAAAIRDLLASDQAPERLDAEGQHQQPRGLGDPGPLQ